MATRTEQLDRDDWAKAMAEAAGLDRGMTNAVPAAPPDRSSVTCQTLDVAGGGIDVQIVEWAGGAPAARGRVRR